MEGTWTQEGIQIMTFGLLLVVAQNLCGPAGVGAEVEVRGAQPRLLPAVAPLRKLLGTQRVKVS